MMMNDWYKSSYSQGGGDNCVECRGGEGSVQVRDTQNRSLGHLSFPMEEWAALLWGARSGEL
ncbi:DUF397 domain-containing protein [Nocardiopsis chromatogenes]|uniref:DUF397 domain-containing protein n=1 Tax=Nocardiopsis chromatogenes TaxID=280239 RepID=UPI000346B3E4|nr:DUF397 domain-containing protein [Nocardiopsis chromatogenes]